MTGRPSAARAAAGVWALAGITILLQIPYPLLHDPALRACTLAAVAAFWACTSAHCAMSRGAGAALRLVMVAGGLGLAVEAVGVRTGVPFGPYRYTGTLGPQLLGVPVAVALAWTMMAYPCLLLGRRLAPGSASASASASASGSGSGSALGGPGHIAGGPPSHLATAVIGGATLAAWDLFLDPQMVDAGRWAFASARGALPGVPGVPLTNYAGWLLVAPLVVAALDRVVPGPATRGEAAPATLLAWTWLGSTVANIWFFHRPWVGVWGGAAMAVTVVPYLARLRPTSTAGHRARAALGAPADGERAAASRP